MSECDFQGVNNRTLSYDQQWLPFAIPSTDGNYDKCHRYAPEHMATPGIISGDSRCSSDMFNTSMKIACTEYVHASDEKNLQTEVN